MNQFKLVILFFAAGLYSCFSQIHTYYNSVDFSQTGENLKTQLALLVETTHTYDLNYTPDVWNILKTSDLDPDNPQNVLLIYGYDDTDQNIANDRSRDKDMSCHVSNCTGLWVREHVFPRSLGTPNLGFEYAGADAHHLRPIDSQMNSTRSNRKFGNGEGNAKVLPNGNFYPGDQWKGDVARMMMYMYLRYPDQCIAIIVGTGSTSYSLLNDMPDIFLEWNEQDPVDEVEMTRNNVIQSYQGNRNPFIDNPYLATLIWGGPQADNTWEELSTEKNLQPDIFLYPTITSDYLYIKKDTYDSYKYEIYNVTGQFIREENLTNQIDLSDLNSGMYFIRIKNENKLINFKVIKK